MPFSHPRRRVAPFLEHFWQQPFAFRNSISARVIVCPVHADTIRVTTSHQRRTRRGTNSLGDIETCKPRTLLRQLIEMGCLETDGSLNTHIGITHIVGDNQDDIWRASKNEPFRQEGSQRENNRSQRNISSTHEFHLPFGCQKLADEIYWAGM